MVTLDDIVRALRESLTPLSVADIASKTGGDIRSCDAILWQNPEQFVWQPGHRWTLARSKSHVPRINMATAQDARSSESAAGALQNQLRALTLASGLTIAVDRRSLDSDAFFSVRSNGNRISLTFNSSHEIFSELPLPFDASREDTPYKALCEMLLGAWALYEDGLPEGQVRRAAQDARLLWGRRVIEMLRESRDV